MFSYNAYNLGIRSFLPLPELVSEERDPNVTLLPGRVSDSYLQRIDNFRKFGANLREASYAVEGVGKFLVRDGREVVVDSVPNTDERALRLCILGPVLALLLHQRGLLVLHASAVAIAGDAVAFVGGQGWGKSSIAAALHSQGHDILTDDVTAIRLDSTRPTVSPAYPQLKLWPDSVRALGELPEALPFLHPKINKRAYHVGGHFAHATLPIGRIYVLAQGPEKLIEPLCPREAFVELLCHSYAGRFGTKLFEGTGMAKHFNQCARLAQTARVYRFRRPVSLALLHEHAKLLTNDPSAAT